MAYNHIPVMVNEVIHFLNVKPGKKYVDCTMGGAGHAKAILDKMMLEGFLVGIDQDKDAVENAKKVLSSYAPKIAVVHDNFVNIKFVLSQLNINKVDGILADLGISFHQLAQSGRGFTFQRDEPLDMRMDTDLVLTAGDIINTADEKKLADIFFRYGEERWSRQIALNIVKARNVKAIQTSFELVRIILDSIPKKFISKPQRIHPATRVFMALRIAVNHELERLESFLDITADILNSEGRLCILSFHSLEDRIVKHKIKALEKGCTCPPTFPQCVCFSEKKLRFLTKKPVRPTEQEVEINPMARSTRLRAAERI
ncbi:MAG: 16S rRNA (cytosine(1402)-N(4))-methyltransferase RsmH [Desulfobacterales bacterium]|nr:16S rRNA (cytosine(1402)-N(4))-methyltransferase RsmH [Desulfobacterales bacterium]